MSKTIMGLEVDIYSVDFVNMLQDKLDRLESVNAQLVEENERLRGELLNQDKHIEHLQQRVDPLQAALEAMREWFRDSLFNFDAALYPPIQQMTDALKEER